MINPILAYPKHRKLIVNQLNNQEWAATFSGIPKVIATADRPFSAIQELLKQAGDPSLMLNSLRPVHEETQPDRLVFEIPPVDWRPRLMVN